MEGGREGEEMILCFPFSGYNNNIGVVTQT